MRSAASLARRAIPAVQIVGEQRVELHAQQPSLGEQSSMLLDERHKVLRHVAVREHHRFTEHGTHLGAADVEHVRDTRDVFKRHVVAGCGQRVAKSCAVDEQWHVVLRADLADRLEFVERVERAVFGGLRNVDASGEYHMCIVAVRIERGAVFVELVRIDLAVMVGGASAPCVR